MTSKSNMVLDLLLGGRPIAARVMSEKNQSLMEAAAVSGGFGICDGKTRSYAAGRNQRLKYREDPNTVWWIAWTMNGP
jgi:hypothetical protein